MINRFISRFFRPRNLWVRKIVQVIFFLLIFLIALNHQLAESGAEIPFLSNASLHSICPFGGVVSLYQYSTIGTFTQKIHQSSFVLMVLVLFSAFLFGPAFCGWVCPLGTIQEWIGKIGKKIFRRRYNHFIPKKLDVYLRYLRYLVLLWVLYVTAYSGKLIFSEYDPYFALFNFWTSEAAMSGILILLITLALSLFVERPWCKYACPFGAVLGLTNLVRLFTIKRSESSCRLDGACDIICPMNIPVSEKKVVRDHQCISCLECTSEGKCPVAQTVTLAVGRSG